MKVSSKKIEKILCNLDVFVQKYDNIYINNPLCFEVENIVSKINSVNIPSHINIESFLKDCLIDSLENDRDIIESIDNGLNNISNTQQKTILQTYFGEIKTIYDKESNNLNIEYCDQNRERLINTNLKTVISIAKRYQGMGVPMEDLVSAGNLGLIIAWEKFDPDRINFKGSLLDKVSKEQWPKPIQDAFLCMDPLFKYGNIKDKFHEYFKDYKVVELNEIENWINKYVNNIKFSSVASMWIRAEIIKEIEEHSRLVRIQKSDVMKIRDATGVYPSDQNTIVDLQDMNQSYEEYDSEGASDSSDIICKLKILFKGVDKKTKSIILRRFGIGLPRPMTPKEVAEFENISNARVSQLFNTGLKKMKQNAIKYNVDTRDFF